MTFIYGFSCRCCRNRFLNDFFLLCLFIGSVIMKYNFYIYVVDFFYFYQNISNANLCFKAFYLVIVLQFC